MSPWRPAVLSLCTLVWGTTALQYCLQVRTGDGDYDAGFLSLEVNEGNGYVSVVVRLSCQYPQLVARH